MRLVKKYSFSFFKSSKIQQPFFTEIYGITLAVQINVHYTKINSIFQSDSHIEDFTLKEENQENAERTSVMNIFMTKVEPNRKEMLLAQ